MNKADRERVEITEQDLRDALVNIYIDATCYNYDLLESGITELIELRKKTDKQDKVVEAAKRHKARSVATEQALKDLDEDTPVPGVQCLNCGWKSLRMPPVCPKCTGNFFMACTFLFLHKDDK